MKTAMVIGWAALSPVSKRPCFSGVAKWGIYLANAGKGQGWYTFFCRLERMKGENGFGLCNPVFS